MDYHDWMVLADLLVFRSFANVLGDVLNINWCIGPWAAIDADDFVVTQEQAACNAASDGSTDPCDQHLHVQPLVSGSSTPGIFRIIKSRSEERRVGKERRPR